jgi:hypothetical protein
MAEPAGAFARALHAATIARGADLDASLDKASMSNAAVRMAVRRRSKQVWTPLVEMTDASNCQHQTPSLHRQCLCELHQPRTASLRETEMQLADLLAKEMHVLHNALARKQWCGIERAI